MRHLSVLSAAILLLGAAQDPGDRCRASRGRRQAAQPGLRDGTLKDWTATGTAFDNQP